MLLSKYIEWESCEHDFYPIRIFIDYNSIRFSFGEPFYESEFNLNEDLEEFEEWLTELDFDEFFSEEIKEYYNFNIDEDDFCNGK